MVHVGHLGIGWTDGTGWSDGFVHHSDVIVDGLAQRGLDGVGRLMPMARGVGLSDVNTTGRDESTMAHGLVLAMAPALELAVVLRLALGLSLCR